MLLSLGLKLVAITLGEDGVLVATKNGKEHVAGFHTNAIDTTGAGDSFWGGFLSRFLSLNKAVEELTGTSVTESYLTISGDRNALPECSVVSVI